MDHPLKQRRSTAIKLEGVQVTLPSRAGPVAILRGIDLSVAAGEAIAVVGPSGSGKSTLLMVIAGLERATDGGVEVMATDYATLDEDGLARLRGANIGIVFQSFHLVPTMTAIENVALPLEFLDRDDAFATARRRWPMLDCPIANRISPASFPAASSREWRWHERSAPALP